MSVSTPEQPATIAGSAVRVNGIHHTFANGVEAIRRVDLSIDPGEFVAILGPSGCGKSTLLRIIAGLEMPTEGHVAVDAPATTTGADLSYKQGRRSDIAFVFQDAHLLPWRTVLDNAALPLELQGVNSAERRSAAVSALQAVGLAGFEARYPSQLSGGMKMRVSIARAIVTRPRLLLMDEPFAALDEITRQRLDDMLRRLWVDSGMTVLFVTHSTEEATFLANRAIVMSRRPGRIILDHPFDLPADRTPALRSEERFVRQMRTVYTALEASESTENA